MGNPEQIVVAAPELDPSFLSLSHTEFAFLHSTVSANEEELKTRLLDVQKRSYAQYPYPCIRGFLFVKLMMSSTPRYPAVLEAGKKGDTYFLDIGCCMGSDVRKLVQDGYPASHALACDLREEFIKLGYELYRDADTCPVRFFSANVFDFPLPLLLVEPAAHSAGPGPDPTSVTDLAQLRGALTHIYTGSLFHLFDEETQYGLALRLGSLLKRTPGAVIFGRHQGLIEEGYIDDQVGRHGVSFSMTPA
ncbi:hypothetical protein BD413DRAFT_187497 [Trametes elegans]|nr:hypothetical protein BD413DRAFT_187497 [Trametes elegans]